MTTLTDEIRRAADVAIEAGIAHRYRDFVLVPDVHEIEVIANGFELPDTWRLVRDDGRSVLVFRRREES